MEYVSEWYKMLSVNTGSKRADKLSQAKPSHANQPVSAYEVMAMLELYHKW